MTGTFKVRWNQALAVVCVVALGGSYGFANDAEVQATGIQVAQEKPAAPEKPTGAEKPANSTKRKWEGYQLQELDEPLTPFVPKTPRTQADVEAIESLSWLAVGQIFEQRSDMKSAVDAYKKGLKHNANSLVLVRKLMALSLALGNDEEGIQYAHRAMELNPSDARSLRMVGKVLAPDDPARAIQLFERAIKSPTLAKESPMYVTLMLDLGLLYNEANRKAEAADCLAVVFDAMQNPEKYKLDNDVRKELQSNRDIEFERLGQVFLNAGKPDLALEAFQKAVDTKRGSVGSHAYNLAQVYHQTKHPDKALAELQKYFDAQRQAKGRAAYELLATILKDLGKEKELIAKLEELAEKDPNNTTLAFYLGSQYVAGDRLSDAEALFKKALTKDSDPEGYKGLLQIYRQQNRAKDLIALLAKIYTKKKNLEGFDSDLVAISQNAPLLDEMLNLGLTAIKAEKPDLEVSSLYVLAKLAGQGKRYDAATELFRHVIASSRTQKLKFQLYDELGDLLTDAKRFVELAKMYAEAAADPDLEVQRSNLVYQQSRALEFAGQTQEALDVAEKAKTLFPEYEPLFQFQIGWIYYHSVQYEKAIPLFEKIIAAEKKKPIAEKNAPILKFSRSSLSNIHVLMGNMLKGEQVLEDMLLEDENDPGVNNDLGYLYADQGKNLEKAEKMILKAVRAEPENAAYLDSLAWVLYKRGKYQEALVQMEKSLEKSQAKQNAADATLWDHLGDIQDRLKNAEKAVAAWKKALESAKAESHPDAKLIGRIEDKLKNQAGGQGNLKPERATNP
ncbi:MAG: Tetratricopeptide 2 repeat protein [Planctomycetaceae bacterium]|nr:Tetratricopeptide 2 repeat protein [Planctomycetaceae bacterium]